MCATCGCSDGSTITLLDLTTTRTAHHHGDGVYHTHESDGTAHTHRADSEMQPSPLGARTHVDGTTVVSHAHAFTTTTQGQARAEVVDVDASRRASTIVALELAVLAKNDRLADLNRSWFRSRRMLALNLMSSPGSGKTTLLERTIREIGGELPFVVIEGDQATANDGERIRAAGAPAVQVNTGTGCHLEAEMIAGALDVLAPADGAIVVIENVGNLVCPALFDLGENAKVAVISVTEGDDKPQKYPHMFAAAQLVIINKIDLLPYVDFSIDRCIAAARALRPQVEIIELSARTGAGMDAWYDWLRHGRDDASAAEPDTAR